MAIDQQSPPLRKLADDFGLTYATDSMCGFIAIATVLKQDDDGIFSDLKSHILPWIVERRRTYVTHYQDEFVPFGTPYSESRGRMAAEVYLGMMTSTVELAEYMRLQTQEAHVALLRNVLEGPAVNEFSVRFPRKSGDFIAKEELDYINQEAPFHGSDHYMQLAGNDGQLMSMKQWCSQVFKSRDEWKVIIDGHGHYHVLRIAFSEGDNEYIVLEELDSLEREKDFYSQPCENLIQCLMEVSKTLP
jgi:hypothetical protein